MDFRKNNYSDTLVLDVETGGLNSNTNAVCSVSFLFPGEIIPKTIYIQPYGLIYEKEALEINGLTKEFLKDNGVPVEDFRILFVSEISKYFKPGQRIKLLGHNISFDIGFLKRLLTEPLYNEIFHYHFKDTMVLAHMFKDNNKFEKLESLSLFRVYRYLFDDGMEQSAHKSDMDVMMTIKVYNKLIDTF